ncbi:MAG: hypothetical protein WCD89_14710 [Anaerocolumna sp.]
MMDNELKEILESFKSDILDNISLEMKKINDRLDVVDYKLDRTSEKVDKLDLKIRNAESNIRKDIRKLSDDNETIVEVLKQHDFIPR